MFGVGYELVFKYSLLVWYCNDFNLFVSFLQDNSKQLEHDANLLGLELVGRYQHQTAQHPPPCSAPLSHTHTHTHSCTRALTNKRTHARTHTHTHAHSNDCWQHAYSHRVHAYRAPMLAWIMLSRHHQAWLSWKLVGEKWQRHTWPSIVCTFSHCQKLI